MSYWKYEGHKGIRYFHLSDTCHKVIQVCVDPGELKKGRTNCIGVYLIDRMTMMGNYAYFANPSFKPCSKKEYNAAMNKVLKLLI